MVFLRCFVFMKGSCDEFQAPCRPELRGPGGRRPGLRGHRLRLRDHEKQVEVSPEFTEKTQNMLKNMGPQMKQQKQAEAAAKKAAAAEGRKAP